MPFTAPTFAQSDPTTNNLPPGARWVVDPNVPVWGGYYVDSKGQVVPGLSMSADGEAAKKAADDALLKQLNLPPGWSVVDRANPETVLDKNGKPVGDGKQTTQAITLAGPNGQPGQIIVDQNNHIVSGGELNKNPDKPTNEHPNVTPGEGVWDPNANDGKGGYVVPIPTKPTAPPAQTHPNASPGEGVWDPNANNGNGGYVVPVPATPPKDTSAADAERKRVDDAQIAADQATIDAKNAELDYNNRKLAADTAYQNGKLSQDQWIAERTAAHQEAQDAQAKVDAANQRLRDIQTAQYQQGTLANQTAQNTETARSNKAREANDAATLLEAQQRDQQASADRQMQTGAGLLQQHAQEATGALNNWVNAAASNKNFGLGGAIPATLGADLMSDANSFATQAMGGQSLMDKAMQLVHQANPALANTPAGAGYAAVAAQMLEKQTQPQMQAPNPAANSNTAMTLGAQNGPPTVGPSSQSGIPAGGGLIGMSGSSTPAISAPFAQSGLPEGSSRGVVSPSDPNFLGQVISAAVQHFTAPGAAV